MNVTVVIPAYNARDNLQLLVPEVVRRGDYRVLVVDDDSPDGTGEVADALALKNPGRGDVCIAADRGASSCPTSTHFGARSRATLTSSARWMRTSRMLPNTWTRSILGDPRDPGMQSRMCAALPIGWTVSHLMMGVVYSWS